MDSVDSLFDQYDRGRITRRALVQSLAVLALPATILGQKTSADQGPIIGGLGVNHIGLTVSDIERSHAFYHRLFGVSKGWPATDAGTGIHLDFPVGYISVDSTAEKKGVITHFSVSVDSIDQDSAKRLAARINEQLPDARATAAFQANDGVSTVNLHDPDGIRVQISPKGGR